MSSTAAAVAAMALPRMPWALLAAACLGMFAASCSGTTRAPFLLDMAREQAADVRGPARVVHVRHHGVVAFGEALVGRRHR